MYNIKLINNIVFDGEIVGAIGRLGDPTDVFLRQGTLDGACAVYSMMMMLMFHGMISREDIMYKTCRKDPPYIKRLKELFVKGIRGYYLGGYTFMELKDSLQKIMPQSISVEVDITEAIKGYNMKAEELHMNIKEHLDKGWPVQVGFNKEEGGGHAVVAIGYTICYENLRLYCLDPARNLPLKNMWNNVIDLNTDYNESERWDNNHLSRMNVEVDQALMIKEPKNIDETLPF